MKSATDGVSNPSRRFAFAKTVSPTGGFLTIHSDERGTSVAATLLPRRTLDAGFWFAPTRRQLCNRFRQSLSRRSGQAGAVFQRVKPWNSQAPTHGKFWVDVPGGDRKQKTILLGPCATRTIACRRLRLHLDQSGVNSKQTFNESTVPATTFKQQAE
jgi:hypothetical protein